MNILYIADHREETHEIDKRNAIEWAMNERGTSIEFEDIEKDKKYKFKEIILDETSQNQTIIQNEADRADVIVVDYGGMSRFACGAQGLIDHWNRFFLNLIESRTSKEWYIASCVNMYEDDDHERLEKIGVKLRW